MISFGIIWIFLLEKSLGFVNSDTIAVTDSTPGLVTSLYCFDSSVDKCSKLNCNFIDEARKYCPKKCGFCRTCEDTHTDCSALKQNNQLCTLDHFLHVAAENCPRSCHFCTPCNDTDDIVLCEGLKRYCDQNPNVEERCRKTCNKCKSYNASEIIEKYKGNQTQTTSITMSPASTTLLASQAILTTVPATSVTAHASRDCDKFGVIVSVAKGNAVSFTGTSSCPDGVHQPSEALIQKYCGAPNISNWNDGAKVMENCQNVPHYTAIAAVTFGGPPVAGVFIKCEANGFQVAIQTCQSPLQLYHVSTNATTNIPKADKFVLINWKD